MGAEVSQVTLVELPAFRNAGIKILSFEISIMWVPHLVKAHNPRVPLLTL